MRDDIHNRALELSDKRHVEGLTAEERSELGAHLASCDQCQEQARKTDRTLRRLRSAVPRFDVALVQRTQLRAQVRAREIIENRARMRAVWISCTLSWILGVVSAPLLWRGLEWIGHRLAVSRAVWMAGFALSWVAPAAVVAALIAWRREHGARATGEQ